MQFVKNIIPNDKLNNFRNIAIFNRISQYVQKSLNITIRKNSWQILTCRATSIYLQIRIYRVQRYLFSQLNTLVWIFTFSSWRDRDNNTYSDAFRYFLHSRNLIRVVFLRVISTILTHWTRLNVYRCFCFACDRIDVESAICAHHNSDSDGRSQCADIRGISGFPRCSRNRSRSSCCQWYIFRWFISSYECVELFVCGKIPRSRSNAETSVCVRCVRMPKSNCSHVDSQQQTEGPNISTTHIHMPAYCDNTHSLSLHTQHPHMDTNSDYLLHAVCYHSVWCLCGKLRICCSHSRMIMYSICIISSLYAAAYSYAFHPMRQQLR